MAVTSVLVTTAGLGYIVDSVDTALTTPHIAHGTGSTAAAAGDTTLGTETDSRASATVSQPSANILRAVATVTCTASRALREVGLLTASSVGTLITRAVFDVINLSNTETIEYTINVTFADNS